MGFARPLSLTLSLVATSANTALADGDAPAVEAPAEPKHHRQFGFGTYGGGGYVFWGATLRSSSCVGPEPCNQTAYGLGPQFEFPTLLVQGFPFAHNDFSIDANVSLTETLMWAAGGAWKSDVYFNFNVGSGIPRFIVGPGLGFSVVANLGPAWSFRVPAQIGLELLTSDEAFGFKFLAQPLFVIAGSPHGGIHAGGGGQVLLGLSGYKRESPPPDPRCQPSGFCW